MSEWTELLACGPIAPASAGTLGVTDRNAGALGRNQEIRIRARHLEGGHVVFTAELQRVVVVTLAVLEDHKVKGDTRGNPRSALLSTTVIS